MKFEDFCDHPGLELSKIWNFSDLSIPSELKDKIAKNDNFGILPGGLHGDSRGNKFSLKVPDKVKKIMDFYDYKIF